ncbi:hypothetical protein MIR68_011148 [Amoeboaphelidium protococcarum]|nr:hypothetical protein MIR68_011148 [Amoeboaphelidium protococcarum]
MLQDQSALLVYPHTDVFLMQLQDPIMKLLSSWIIQPDFGGKDFRFKCTQKNGQDFSSLIRYAFACEARSIGYSRSYPGSKIELKEDVCGFVSTRPIRQSPMQTKAMEYKMKQMIEYGVITECDHSDFISNMFMVKKGNPKHPLFR